MPDDREQHERVVLALGQVIALGRAGRDQDRQQADGADRDVEEERVVVAEDHAEPDAVELPLHHRRDDAADEADDARSHADRHPLARAAEGLGEQHRARRQRDDENRNDGDDVGPSMISGPGSSGRRRRHAGATRGGSAVRSRAPVTAVARRAGPWPGPGLGAVFTAGADDLLRASCARPAPSASGTRRARRP